MKVSEKDLDKLFNSSANGVDDEELLALHNKAGCPSDLDKDLDEDDDEISNVVGSGSGGGFAKKKEEKPDYDDDTDGFDLVVEEEEEEEEEEESEKEEESSRVPFDIDFDEEDEGEEKPEPPVEKEESSADIEDNTKAEEKKEAEEEVEEAEGENEDEGDFDYEAEESDAIKDQLSSVCKDPKYLEDPRYLLFYREKLRASNFLKGALPKINYKKLSKELSMMYVKVDEDGPISLDEFNQKIQKVQALRTRLTQIRSMTTRDYILRKRVTKLLEECLNKQSPEKSNDKRMGELQIHMSDMEYRFAMSEAFYKDVEQIMENISCAHEALSRQITCMQERNKEISRGEEPYVESKSNDKWDVVAHKEHRGGYKKWDEVM
jgi:hypothetical protein